MTFNNKNCPIQTFNKIWNIVQPGDHLTTINFCVDHFIECAKEAIADHGYFAVALSGGSTPKTLYQKLADPENAKKVDWSKIKLFWSDERSVPPFHKDSNYHMAMEEAGLHLLPIPADQIHRMQAEENIENNALAYEALIKSSLVNSRFDLVILGMGDDGHTASLFPQTHGLNVDDRLVIANFVPKLDTWRMTLTYKCINDAHHIVIYVLGKNKIPILKKVLNADTKADTFPIQGIGTSSHKALWVLDKEAAKAITF